MSNLGPKDGVVSDLMPSGAGFVTFEDGRQAYMLRSLVSRMQLRRGQMVRCSLVPNFADHLTEQVPWRAVRIDLLDPSGAPVAAPDGSNAAPDTTEALSARARENRVLEALRGDTFVWTEEQLSGELDGMELVLVRRALSTLQAKGLVSRANVYAVGQPSRTYWAAEGEDLMPVGLFDQDDA